MTEIEVLGGFIYELYQSCNNNSEFKQQLKTNPKISRLLDKWKEWLQLCYQTISDSIDTKQLVFANITVKAFKVPKLPFTDEELNYLNSRFLDGMKRIELSSPPVKTNIYFPIVDQQKYNVLVNSPAYYFYMACKYGYLEIAKWLTSVWVDIKSMDTFKLYQPFLLACINGRIEVAKWLREEYPKIHLGVYTVLVTFILCLYYVYTTFIKSCI